MPGSFARAVLGSSIKNWAAAGFWQDLIAGLEIVKQRDVPKLQLAFFTFHDKIEGQHKEHVWDGLYADAIKAGEVKEASVTA